MRMTLDVYEHEGELWFNLPAEVIEECGWSEGALLEWIDNKDGSWTLKEKKMDFVEKIVEFNEVAGTEAVFEARKVALYIGLQLEEMGEKIDSIPGDALSTLKEILDRYATEFKVGKYDEMVKGIDRVSALDADVDLAVVALGGAVAIGSDVHGACHEVMDSNLSKFPIGADGKRYALKDANGKVMKPAGYRPPSLEQYLK